VIIGWIFRKGRYDRIAQLHGGFFMSHSNKKQRREQKRKAKQRESRRQNSISPVKRLIDAPGEVECWMSDDFEEMGQRQIFAYKRAAGLSGLFCFLIDRGVVGLKDCWGQAGVSRDYVESSIDRCADRGIRMRRTNADVARRWVLAAARWAHDNGMRLPKDWTRVTSVLGDVTDWQSADVSGFVKEFAGHPEDLRQRLVGESLESYLAREDVKVVFNTDAPYLDQETGRYSDWDDDDDLDEAELETLHAMLDEAMPVEEVNAMADKLAPAAQELASQTAEWLKAHQHLPSDQLFEAWKSMILASLLATSTIPDAPNDEVADFSGELLESLTKRIDPSDVDEYERAIQQAFKHLEADKTVVQKVVLKHGFAGGLKGEESLR
jgi:hypothetical protein